MLLYNVTVNVDKAHALRWVQWMKEKHIADVMETGCFDSYKFFELLHESEDGSINYAVQYFTSDMERMQAYHQKFAPQLQADVKKEFGDSCASFRTLLKEI
ncbi:MAG: DUF4286 family protein [Nitritalea sp.]